MQTRSSLQRRSNSESSDRVVAHIKPRPWGDETHEQPQTVQRQTSGFDFRNVDWFSHDPGPRSPVRVFNTIQAKLKVGAPNDVYEQEADRVAEQVMSTPDSATHQSIQREDATEEESAVQAKPLAATITPIVQREMALEEDEDEPVQAKLIQREAALEEELVPAKSELQRKASPAGFQAQPRLEQQLDSSKGGGSPLPDDVRAFMEPRFRADFSQVRVHTGSEAVQMNRDLSAQAFTHQQHVYFGAGKSPAKDALTAHELTHVVQQTGAIQTKQVFGSLPIQLKCSACEKEDNTLQRSVNISRVSQVVQRREIWELSGNSAESCKEQIAEDAAVCSDHANTACTAGAAASAGAAGLVGAGIGGLATAWLGPGAAGGAIVGGGIGLMGGVVGGIYGYGKCMELANAKCRALGKQKSGACDQKFAQQQPAVQQQPTDLGDIDDR